MSKLYKYNVVRKGSVFPPYGPALLLRAEPKRVPQIHESCISKFAESALRKSVSGTSSGTKHLLLD